MESLSSIDEQVVPMFREAAKTLLAEIEPEVALALALAKITGHTQLRVTSLPDSCTIVWLRQGSGRFRAYLKGTEEAKSCLQHNFF